MSRRIDPVTSTDQELGRTTSKQQRGEISTPRSQAIKDDTGAVRVRIGKIGTRYGVRVYDSTGAVAYDFTVTP